MKANHHLPAICLGHCASHEAYTPYRGPIVIHAGKSKEFMTLTLNDGSKVPWNELLYGYAIGIADLIAVWSVGDWQGKRPSDGGLNSDVVEAMKSCWAEGPYCWIFNNVRALKEPVKMPGNMRVWEIRDELLKL
jgi:hypothetical protein